MSNVIPFSPPFIDENIIQEVSKVLRSGWITSGPKVKELEVEICRYVGVDKAACVNSASSGILMALSWLGIGEGDEVIIPAYTYCATALPILHLGAKPVMVDVCEDFNINIEEVRRKITPRTKAIIPVDIGGFPCDYQELQNLVNNEHILSLFCASSEIQSKFGRIAIIADSAHSFGAVYMDRKIGAVADMTIFSFHAVKNLTTAEGGAITLNLPSSFDEDEEYRILKLLSLNGQTKDALSKSSSGNWQYDIVLAGFKANMPDICAVIGLEQLKTYNKQLARRRDIVNQYNTYLRDVAGITLPVVKDLERESSYHLYMIRIDQMGEKERNLIIEKVTKSGISVNVHFCPLPMLSLFKKLGYEIDDYPVAKRLFQTEISLPLYPMLSDVEVKRVSQSVKDAFLEVSAMEYI